jgi:hypothetical protein
VADECCGCFHDPPPAEAQRNLTGRSGWGANLTRPSSVIDVALPQSWRTSDFGIQIYARLRISCRHPETQQPLCKSNICYSSLKYYCFFVLFFQIRLDLQRQMLGSVHPPRSAIAGS